MERLGVVYAAVAAFAFAACVEPAGPTETIDEQFAVVCGDGPTVRGMDVSYYETSIDWRAAHDAGIEFAFIRVSDGLQFMDPKFPEYWAGARAAGVIRGAYQFFRPAQDPIAQADLLLEGIGSLAAGDLPPVIDVEVSGDRTQSEVAEAVRAWVARVTDKLGRVPIVYAGLYSWPDLTGSADLTTSPLWIPQYTSRPCPNIPTPWTRWMFWQFSATGSVTGIPGGMLDLDVFNGTLEALRAFTAAGACGDGSCSGGETTETCTADCPPCGTIGPDGGVIDDGEPCFIAGGPPRYLRPVADSGDGGDLIWTHATASSAEANFAQWNLFFAEAGRYRVEAYTAHRYASSRRAAYVINAGGSSTTVTIDQTALDGWQLLGELMFGAGGAQSVHLGDNTGEPTADNAQLVFDAVRLTRIRDDLPPSSDDPPPSGDEPPPSSADGGGCATGPATRESLAFVLLVCARLRRRRR